MFDTKRVTDNVFAEAQVIPGAALKAAVFDAIHDHLSEGQETPLSENVFIMVSQANATNCSSSSFNSALQNLRCI